MKATVNWGDRMPSRRADSAAPDRQTQPITSSGNGAVNTDR